MWGCTIWVYSAWATDSGSGNPHVWELAVSETTVWESTVCLSTVLGPPTWDSETHIPGSLQCGSIQYGSFIKIVKHMVPALGQSKQPSHDGKSWNPGR